MSEPRADYDNPWQEVLERYFRECLALFLPQAHADIDWTREPVFLDKELRQVTPDAELGLRRVDKLVRVWRQNGTDAWGLIHVANPQGAFGSPPRPPREKEALAPLRPFDRLRACFA